jgi:type I restriction enzyme M protein
MAHRPSWFKDGKVVISSAAKCGINKDGLDAVIIDGPRQVEIEDELYADVLSIRVGKTTGPTIRVVPLAEVIGPWRAVPTHFDLTSVRAFRKTRSGQWPAWSEKTIGELIALEWVVRLEGHGSPSKDQREGPIPYIKVSDLRAGLVNINSTNMVPESVAQEFWGGRESGLRPFDLLSPERASSNIGEFCVLMPGQEQVVLTREVIVLRVTSKAPFDQFYLLWALSLQVVKDQWKRVIFMQTNREDVGDRYLEIQLPIPRDRKEARAVSREFRDYFTGMSEIRTRFADHLAAEGLHHFALTGGGEPAED